MVRPLKINRKAADPWKTALRLLARRDYGTTELRHRLMEKGFDPASVDLAVERAVELGFLDDVRYVERLTNLLLETGRAVGPRLVRELRRRGLPEELIDAATASSRVAGLEQATLRDLIARRFPAFDYSAAAAKDRRRVVHFLQRRGFALGQILDELKRNNS